MAKSGPQSSSLQGLERVMHDPPPVIDAARRPGSSRKSSASSMNKSLPPEPPAPLFTCTPSPRSSPRPSPRPQPQILVKHRRSPGFGSRPSSGQANGQPESSNAQPRKGRESRDGPVGGSPPAVDFLRSEDLESENRGRPYSVMSRATSIIDSYAQRHVTESRARSRTPLIAPRAQNSRVLNTQVEKLQLYGTSDLNVPSGHPVSSSITGEANSPNQTMQRKDTLVYRFDTPTEPESQVIFQPPMWAMDSFETAEEIAMRYRDTLPPSPFSPVSAKEDEEIALTPLIPVIPPLPMNSPFRLTGSTLDVNETSANSRKTSPAPSYLQKAQEAPIDDKGTRYFGSQASWEPGDDSLHPRQVSASAASLGRSNLSRSPRSDFDDIASRNSAVNRPLPSQHPSAAYRAPRVASGPSFGNSSPGLSAASPKRPDTPRSVSPLNSIDGPDGPKSYWSDDSDDASKGLKSFSPRLRKMRKEAGSQSTSSTKSGASPVSTDISSQRPGSNSHHQDVLENRKERRNLSQSLDNSLEDMYNTLASLSLSSRAMMKKPAQKKIAKGDVKAEQRSALHRSLPLSAASASTSFGPVRSLADGDLRTAILKKSKAWAIQLGSVRSSSDGESIDEKPPRSERGWLSKLRKKNRAEAQREKWREELKGKIKVIQAEPQGLMALVATPEVRERTAAAAAAAATEVDTAFDHF